MEDAETLTESPSIWEILTSEERCNVISRAVNSSPGTFPSCLARDFSVPCAEITRHTKKLESSGSIVRVHQKMIVTAGVKKGTQRYSNVRVNRLYPAGKVPEIDYENERFEPTYNNACTRLWYFLSPKEKMDVIVREVKSKGDFGLTLDAISKRIGMSRAVAAKWVNRMVNSGLFEIHVDDRRGEYYTATWKAIRSRSSVGSGSLVSTR
jgi:hypothetical protein